MIAPDQISFGKSSKIANGLVRRPAIPGGRNGQCPQLAKQAQQQIQGSKLVIIDGVGHLPQIKAFDRFIAPLRKFLAN